jgi:acyl-coenzyme A synthetase/AMP-(fatty) acid ligase
VDDELFAARAVLLVPPGPDFFPLVFGIFKTGAVMVAIDPGIGRKALLQCLAEVQPEAFIGIPAAHVARVLFPKPFRSVTANVTVGRRFLWGGHTLDEVKALGRGGAFPMVEPSPNETAAILFTSGSTGIPKGVVYSHEIFDSQRHFRTLLDAMARPGKIDRFAPVALTPPPPLTNAAACTAPSASASAARAEA